MPEHVGRVEGFEGPIVGLVEGDLDRHDFAQTQLAGSLALVLPTGEEVPLPGGFKGSAEIIDITEQFQ